MNNIVVGALAVAVIPPIIVLLWTMAWVMVKDTWPGR